MHRSPLHPVGIDVAEYFFDNQDLLLPAEVTLMTDDHWRLLRLCKLGFCSNKIAWYQCVHAHGTVHVPICICIHVLAFLHAVPIYIYICIYITICPSCWIRHTHADFKRSRRRL
jgi:hypothetical protein